VIWRKPGARELSSIAALSEPLARHCGGETLMTDWMQVDNGRKK
jgi:hypothetical protein